MKKIPQRSCVVCRTKKDKNELIRIVRNQTNEIIIDESGKKPGKGAYICDSIECLEKGIKSKVLKRALEVDVPEEIYENLRERIVKQGVILLGKVKIYDIAKKLNLTSKEILERAEKLNIEAKSHLSNIDEADAQRIEESFKTGDKKPAAKPTKKE